MASAPALTTFSPSGLIGSFKNQTQTSTPGYVPQKQTTAPATGNYSSGVAQALGVQPAPAVPAAPSHPEVSNASSSNLVSHTYTTNPDGTTTTQVKYAQPNAQSQPTSQSSPQTTFGGLIGGLANASGAGSQAVSPYTSLLSQYGQGSIDAGKRAADIAAEYGQKIADVGGQGARFQAGQLTTGTSPVAEGNAAVTAQTTAAQQAALAAGEQAALLGTGQQLTGFNQAANAANQAASQELSGTGQAITGLGTAANLAQPSTAAYGQTVFNPVTGQYEAGGGLPPDVLNQYAQMAANGQYSAIPGNITSNPVLSAQLNAAAKAINPNFNPVTSAAAGASAADLTNQVSSIQAQANGAEANFELMQNIAAQGGVNDANVPILNTLQQNVQRGLTSSAAVANFQSLIQSVRSQYAAILGGGTVTVEALHEAQSLIPSDISLSALQSLGENLKSDAQNRVVGIQQQIGSLTGSQGTQNNYASNNAFAEQW